MKKRIFLIACILLLLVACIPVETSLPESEASRSQPAAKYTITPAAMPCTVFHFPVTPQALGGDSSGRAHILGPDTAPVTIIFYLDYQCPVCAYISKSIEQVRESHPQDVRLVFLNTWLSERGNDSNAFRAAEAANLQGKYWGMNDLLFENVDFWRDFTDNQFNSWITQQAGALGMGATQFQQDFTGEVVDALQEEAAQSAENSPVIPPTVYVNGAIPFLVDFASLETTVSLEILTAHQFSSCPPWVINPTHQYLVTLHTEKGDVTLQLFPDKAPLAVNNFIHLARSGWYDQTTFYQVIQGSLVKAGDPSGTGLGNPGYLFETEFASGLDFSQAGMLALDNDGMNTNGSRFFITLGPQPDLNGQYTIFGQVIQGMDLLYYLSVRNPTADEILPPGDELISVTIEER